MMTGTAGSSSQGEIASGLDVRGLLEHDPPANRRRSHAQAEEAERRLADHHAGQRQGGRRDDVAQERAAPCARR